MLALTIHLLLLKGALARNKNVWQLVLLFVSCSVPQNRTYEAAESPNCACLVALSWQGVYQST